MGMKPQGDFREPTEPERLLFYRLLEANFPGRDELGPLMRQVLIKIIDKDGRLKLQSQVEGRAPVVKRIPVEAEAKDEDGAVIHMLLHVVDGRPMVLEFFRDGDGTVIKMPPASAFELIVLPPSPAKGWRSSNRIM